MRRTTCIRIAAKSALTLSALLATSAGAAVVTAPTMDPGALAAALRPHGLVIDEIIIKNGVAGQFGTYSNFSVLPVTIRDGVVLSSGDVTDLSPLLEAQDPNYNPASPPARVNTQMNPDPLGGGTPEFAAYGAIPGNIENFQSCNDVASMEVHFTLSDTFQVQFDFVFGSVEFPYWTSSYTDAFIVFLDGTDPANQITFDSAGNPVQVGSSFAGWETTLDQNTAFSNPHGLIHHLTTTTIDLDRGPHTLIFEVGDVNDQVLDSVAFISRLRTGTGTVGTEPTDDCPADVDDGTGTGNPDGGVDINDLLHYLVIYEAADIDADLDDGSGTGAHDGGVDINDLLFFLFHYEGGC